MNPDQNDARTVWDVPADERCPHDWNPETCMFCHMEGQPEQRQQCPVCQGFLPDDHNGGEFTCPKCGTEFG